jgi:hypothetical protein
VATDDESTDYGKREVSQCALYCKGAMPERSIACHYVMEKVMTEPEKLSDSVRALALRAHRVVNRDVTVDPEREDINAILEDIGVLDRIISESYSQRTELARWVRNLRRVVANHGIAGILPNGGRSNTTCHQPIATDTSLHPRPDPAEPDVRRERCS